MSRNIRWDNFGAGMIMTEENDLKKKRERKKTCQALWDPELRVHGVAIWTRVEGVNHRVVVDGMKAHHDVRDEDLGPSTIPWLHQQETPVCREVPSDEAPTYHPWPATQPLDLSDLCRHPLRGGRSRGGTPDRVGACRGHGPRMRLHVASRLVSDEKDKRKDKRK